VSDIGFGGVRNWKYWGGWLCPRSYKELNKLAPKAFNPVPYIQPTEFVEDQETWSEERIPTRKLIIR
jgi:hypothetical protein